MKCYFILLVFISVLALLCVGKADNKDSDDDADEKSVVTDQKKQKGVKLSKFKMNMMRRKRAELSFAVNCLGKVAEGFDGKCKNKSPGVNYFYSAKDNECQKFDFKGCGGNGNRYVHKFKCNLRCKPDAAFCEADKEEGTEGECPNKSAGDRYYFNTESKSCEKFVFKGCGGNKNRHKNKWLCIRRCGAISRSSLCKPAKDVGRDCNENEKGNATERYFWDAKSTSCGKFDYLGCGGNKNNHKSLRVCEMICKPKKKIFKKKSMSTAISCKSPLNEGSTCSDGPSPVPPTTKFYHDKGICKQFDYKGCEGNSNRFDTEDDCKKKCVRQRKRVQRKQKGSKVKNRTLG